MDAALRLGLRDALDAVDAALVFEAAIGTAASHLEDYLLEAAEVALVGVEDLDRPAPSLRVAAVHAEEIARKQCRFITAGCRPDFDDDILLVEGVSGNQGTLQPFLDELQPQFIAFDFVACERDEHRVGTIVQNGARLVEGLAEVPVFAENAHDLLHGGMLARERLQAIIIGGDLWPRHLCLQLVTTAFDFFEFVPNCSCLGRKDGPRKGGPLSALYHAIARSPARLVTRDLRAGPFLASRRKVGAGLRYSPPTRSLRGLRRTPRLGHRRDASGP